MSELAPDEFDPAGELRRALIVARLEEINLFAAAAKEQSFTEDPKPIAYLMGRTTLLGIQLGISPEEAAITARLDEHMSRLNQSDGRDET
jgi:hypothetical protein